MIGSLTIFEQTKNQRIKIDLRRKHGYFALVTCQQFIGNSTLAEGRNKRAYKGIAAT